MQNVTKKFLSIMMSLILMVTSVNLNFFQFTTSFAYSKNDIQAKLLNILYQGDGGKISCDFDGYVNTKGRHEGIDCVKGTGVSIHSLINGQVINVENSSSSSTLSTLSIYDSENNKTVIYLHSSNISVKIGDTVHQGQVVAKESNRGVPAVHTHVEVRDGQRTNAAKSVDDYTLDNSDPYLYWEKVLYNSVHNPQGYLDFVNGGEGCVNVRGWAFDRDEISESVSVHVYIGGSAGSGHVYGIGKADKERKDVNEAFGITGNHGFDTTFDVSESPGEYDIYVYAINIGEGTANQLIGHSKVTIKAKHTHTYVENVVPVTCTVDGEKTFTCSVCGYSYSEPIKAIGHQYVDTVKSPTYTEGGYTLHTCSVCNDSYKDNETLPSGHVMEEGEAAGQTIPNGGYWIYNEHDMNYFLDVPGVEFSHDGANVQMWYDSSNMPSEFDVWTVTYLENGFYKIRQRGTNLCLDVSDASINRGANVQLSNDNSSFSQQWSISKTQHGYTLQARCSSYNLDVIDGKIESGTNVRTWSANDQKAQSFCFIPYSPDERPIEDGVYNIQSVCSDNYYLDISGEPGEYQNNSNAQIWNGATDKFKIVYTGDGWYKIYEESTELALEVNNGDDQKCFLHNERNIQLYENNASRGQFWKIRKTDDGHYFLISKLSGYYLDLLDGKCSDGQNVSQVYYIGGNPQKWNFIKVNIKGDLNDDGEFNISDVVLLQKRLLAVSDTELDNWKAADLCEDGKLDVFDLCLMKRMLVENS